jgi:hypothetical protein
MSSYIFAIRHTDPLSTNSHICKPCIKAVIKYGTTIAGTYESLNVDGEWEPLFEISEKALMQDYHCNALRELTYLLEQYSKSF